MTAAIAWAGLLLAVDAPVAAPFVFPQTDVTVVYAVAGDPSVRQTLRVAASSGLERLDAPGGGLSVVTDTVHGEATLIDHGANTYALEPAAGGPSDQRARRAPDGVYRQLGTDRVAGLACTDWATHDAAGQPVYVCFTADGILLRARRADEPALLAISVARGPVDPASFAVPAGARRVGSPVPGGGGSAP